MTIKHTVKYTIYLGLNNKDTKKQKYDDKTSLSIASNILLNEGIECFTAITCYGVYKHDDGVVVNETSLKIEVVDTSIKEIPNLLKYAFIQECVLVTKSMIEMELV